MNQSWTIHCDGSAVPNPGRIGLGAVIVAPGGARHLVSQTARDIGCNNEAELRALMVARQRAQAEGAGTAARLQVSSDSRVVVDQLAAPTGAGARPPPIARLEPLFAAARLLMRQFAAVDLRWIPQHRNAE